MLFIRVVLLININTNNSLITTLQQLSVPSFLCIICIPFYSSNLWGKYIYVSVYNPHLYFTATDAVHAWPKTNVTSHKLTFKPPGYHIYTFFLCHIMYVMYTGIYVCVADIYNEYLWIFSKLFKLFTHLALIVSMKTQTDNYIIL